MTSPELFAGLVMGLMGSGHCGAMCGGIAAALGGSTDSKARVLAFHLGRVGSYTLIALLLGGALAAAGSAMPILLVAMRMLAGLLLIAMGLYIANWWPGIRRLESLGAPLWSKLQPLTRKLIPPSNVGAAIALGGLWGWLPCGLVYSALAWSVTAGSADQAALRMLAFGLGTVPAMLALSLAANQLHQLLQKQLTRRLAGAALIVFGCWTLAHPVSMLANEGGGHEHHSGVMAHPNQPSAT